MSGFGIWLNWFRFGHSEDACNCDGIRNLSTGMLNVLPGTSSPSGLNFNLTCAIRFESETHNRSIECDSHSARSKSTSKSSSAIAYKQRFLVKYINNASWMRTKNEEQQKKRKKKHNDFFELLKITWKRSQFSFWEYINRRTSRRHVMCVRRDTTRQDTRQSLFFSKPFGISIIVVPYRPLVCSYCVSAHSIASQGKALVGIAIVDWSPEHAMPMVRLTTEPIRARGVESSHFTRWFAKIPYSHANARNKNSNERK